MAGLSASVRTLDAEMKILFITMYIVGILIVASAVWEMSHNILETIGVSLFWPIAAAALVADFILKAGR